MESILKSVFRIYAPCDDFPLAYIEILEDEEGMISIRAGDDEVSQEYFGTDRLSIEKAVAKHLAAALEALS